MPILRAAGQPGLDWVKVDVLHLLVVFKDGAQGAVDELGLPQFALRAPAMVDRARSRGKAAPRPYFMASEVVAGCTGAQM